jgi:excinuclease ABC subunit A
MATTTHIVIRGAREHNLKNVDVTLPRNRLICVTGVSGSGKSSLAFDTLYAEGQRRYLESLSSYARQFVGQLPKPNVDYIGGLSPSISISQKSVGHNPRSTVGTVTEIHDFLRVLFARVGRGYCPTCDKPITSQTRDQVIARLLSLSDPDRVYFFMAPLIRGQKGEYKDLFEDLRRQGFARARVDGAVIRLSEPPKLERHLRHTIEVVIDRFTIEAQHRSRLAEAVDLAFKLGEGTMLVAEEQRGGEEPQTASPEADLVFSLQYSCASCGTSFPPPSPQMLSFNSPQGMCMACEGIGESETLDAQRILTATDKSLKQGAIGPLGTWSEMAKYEKQELQNIAAHLEQAFKMKRGAMLATVWQELTTEQQHAWLWGFPAAGRLHGGNSNRPRSLLRNGEFVGLIPALMARYRAAGEYLRDELTPYIITGVCDTCHGDRLGSQGRFVRLQSAAQKFSDRPWRSLPDISRLSLKDCSEFFEGLQLDETGWLIATEAVKEIRSRLRFLLDVGLEYLTLGRPAPTLSGGETQRIRLAGQIGSGLVGVLYVLDEPSIGLHPRDNDRLLMSLQRLRDLGNTLLVVEHDEDTMRAADLILDFGPGAGVRGGELVAAGTAGELAGNPASVTGKYLSGEEKIAIPPTVRAGNGHRLCIRGATQNNLKNIDVSIPLGKFVCITGVSGSGKSSLVGDILSPYLRNVLHRAELPVGAHRLFEGIEHLDKVIEIDQSPIGRTPRSNPGTYVKVFDEIRELYAQLPEAKRRGYAPGRFSFNVEGGRCSACEGNGANKLEMDFLADIWVTCPVCEGKRFSRETLRVKYKDLSIADVLETDIHQLLDVFENIPRIAEKLQTLHDVGLDYLNLGQPSPTLSGGEAQRIKLARELSRRSTGRTLYLLDEPTTGLHFADIKLLLKVLHDLVDRGNTVLVIEHNLDVIKTADWIIDLGPEGGDGGGEIIFTGTPAELADCEKSATGRSLRRHLDGGSLVQPISQTLAPATKKTGRKGAKKTEQPITPLPAEISELRELTVQGATEHNLRGVDVTVPRNAMTVFCGPSGSGKSSLAMDTIYAEGQRRYVESLSSYARQFIGQMPKPRVERIDGLSPAVAIEQKNLSHSPRSTVGTVTEIYDYLRVLMARLATMFCPTCDVPVSTQTVDQIVDKIMAYPESTRLYLMAPVDLQHKEDLDNFWQELREQGYARVRVDSKTYAIDQAPKLRRTDDQKVEIVVDRISVQESSRSRITQSVEQTLALGSGTMLVAEVDDRRPETRWTIVVHNQMLACPQCGLSFQPLTPHSFSFNSPLGWCQTCEGIGTQTGTDPGSLLDNSKSLSDGGCRLWPTLDTDLSKAMLATLTEQLGIPTDIPVGELSPSQRRWLLFGSGEQWFETRLDANGSNAPIRFQFKGLYPALEQASKLSQLQRMRLEKYVAEIDCTTCNGSRIRSDAAAAKFQNLTLGEIVRFPLGKLHQILSSWQLTEREQKIAGELVREVKQRVEFLLDVGLEYLALGRTANTLSGGEAQRIRLASQLGSGLCGVLYVLDEPTIGLHPRDNLRLIKAMHKLRDLGNTLLVVEHDRDVIAGSDQIRDFGPGSGRRGGLVVASASPQDIGNEHGSVTGPYLTGQKAIPIPKNRRMIEMPEPGQWDSPQGHWLSVYGAKENTLKEVDVHFPLGAFIAVTGPSGSGKSSLVNDVMYPALARALHRYGGKVGAFNRLEGLNQINKVVAVDQSPLGSSPTSNPATYTGVFEHIRHLFAQLPEATQRGFTARQFSFNVPGGRCEKCEGNGQLKVEMHFLADVWVQCDACKGKRYTEETLEVKYHGHSIHQVLEMPIYDAAKLFADHPKIARILKTLSDVGLDYVALGQAAPTLSGGEAQRVKLAAELSRPDTGRTLYLLDEPTTGLHFEDIAKLLNVLQRLVDLGNTVIVIEHNLDVIKSADWVIDMGPEAGIEGGRVVFAGPPEHLVTFANPNLAKSTGKKKSKREKVPEVVDSENRIRSYTGEALAPVMAAGPYVDRVPHRDTFPTSTSTASDKTEGSQNV